jgi:hypothetical protein
MKILEGKATCSDHNVKFKKTLLSTKKLEYNKPEKLVLGRALWRACNLTAFIHSLTGPVRQPFASRHEGPEFNPHGVLI